MTRKSGRAQATVERLLEQRRQYREWLAKLGPDAIAQFPRAVAERVRTDYRQRLEAVTAALADREGLLREALTAALTRLDGLALEKKSRTDELAEAKLRRLVGEYDQGRFDEAEQAAAAALQALDESFTATQGEVARYQDILGLITGQRVAPEPLVAEAAASQLDALEALGVPETAAGGGISAVEASEPPAPAVGFPEVPPVAEPARPLPPRLAPPPVRSPSPHGTSAFAPAVPGAAQVPPASPLPPLPSALPAPVASPAASASPPPAPAPPLPSPPASLSPPGPPPAARPPPAPGPPPVKPRAPSEAVFALAEGEQDVSEPAKTLRCAECGTLNRPTEWYCEKCGAELSGF